MLALARTAAPAALALLLPRREAGVKAAAALGAALCCGCVSVCFRQALGSACVRTPPSPARAPSALHRGVLSRGVFGVLQGGALRFATFWILRTTDACLLLPPAPLLPPSAVSLLPAPFPPAPQPASIEFRVERKGQLVRWIAYTERRGEGEREAERGPLSWARADVPV